MSDRLCQELSRTGVAGAQEVVDGLLDRGVRNGPQEHEVRRLWQDEEVVGVVVGVELDADEIEQVAEDGEEEDEEGKL